jgi:hypothetical protein
MKRIILPVLFVLCLVFLFTNGANSARQAAQDQATKAKLPGPNWAKVAEGVEALRLWDTRVGPKWPQIAVLRLSAKRHQQLERDPMAFIKEFKIFGEVKLDEVRGHSELVLSEKKTLGDDPVDAWVTIAVHDITTYSGYTSFGVTAIEP